MKVVKTGEVYNYEVVGGQLKIYDNDYRVKRKNRYDLFKIIGSYEGCKLVKLMKKKIPGYNPKRDLKMCKISNMPQPTYQESISKYRYHSVVLGEQRIKRNDYNQPKNGSGILLFII